MKRYANGRRTSGELGSDALMELWCWLWAGIAEREQRIWRDVSSSRDVRLEKEACLELQERMLRHVPAPDDDWTAALPHGRLCRMMDPAAAAAFEAELGTLRELARADASEVEVGGNYEDAQVLVLGSLCAHVARLRTQPRPADLTPPGGLGPVRAFRFHAWLATTVDLLEAGAADEGFESRERWREAVPALRMVLAQWVASLPPSDGTGHYFHTTWNRLAQGVGAEPFARFAAWLGWQARPDSGAPPGAREEVARAFHMLAEIAGRPEEQLRSAAPDPTPPWTPPAPLSPARLGVTGGSRHLFTATLVENTPGEDRWAVPLHQFLAALDRGGSARPVVLTPRAEAPPPPPPPPTTPKRPAGPARLTRVSFFGQEIWSEGEPFPKGEELTRRMARAMYGSDALPAPGTTPPAAQPLPPTKPSPRPSPPVHAETPPRPQQPPPPFILSPEELPPAIEPRLKTSRAVVPAAPPAVGVAQGWWGAFVVAHPRLHGAIEWLAVAGGVAMLLGLPYLFAYLTWSFSIPFVGETLIAVLVVGSAASQLLPADAEGQLIHTPPAPKRT